jgi:phosphoribosyl-dephospho-CoA transferase
MRMPTLSNAAPLAGLALRSQSDSRLVGLSREGRMRAFEEIVRRYREPLVAFAGAIVPANRAEDVVQEALAKAQAALLANEAEVKLKPWLYAIVRHGGGGESEHGGSDPGSSDSGSSGSSDGN